MLGCLNLHGSLLPRWRGAAPIQRAIMAGDTVTGVQVVRMTEGLDEGPILMSRPEPIGPQDTAGGLSERLAVLGAASLPQALAALAEGELREQPQSPEGVTYARKVTPAEARIDWDRPAVDVDRHIRGLSPAPGAWTVSEAARGPVRVKALLSRVEDGAGGPGEVLDEDLLIACGQGAVRLLRAQREGKAAQDGDELARGLSLRPGARLT